MYQTIKEKFKNYDVEIINYLEYQNKEDYSFINTPEF
jgi:hypothetical protein